MSQRCAIRSSSAVVILALPKIWLDSLKAKFVVMPEKLLRLVLCSPLRLL
jgi:hypothetical protein